MTHCPNCGAAMYYVDIIGGCKEYIPRTECLNCKTHRTMDIRASDNTKRESNE